MKTALSNPRRTGIGFSYCRPQRIPVKCAQGCQLTDLTAHPAVGVHLDSFHMNLEEDDLGDAIRQAGDRLIHFHRCESQRGTPGSGVVSWKQVGGGLGEIGYDGFVIIESFDHLSWLGPLAHLRRP